MKLSWSALSISLSLYIYIYIHLPTLGVLWELSIYLSISLDSFATWGGWHINLSIHLPASIYYWPWEYYMIRVYLSIHLSIYPYVTYVEHMRWVMNPYIDLSIYLFIYPWNIIGVIYLSILLSINLSLSRLSIYLPILWAVW